MKKFNLTLSKKRCTSYRRRILDISQNVSALHIGGAFSSTEIMEVIYNYFMNKKEKDCFIMSKGHASILQYVILESQKVLKKNDLDQYCKKNGILGVHPDIGNPGINASTGSLGHGLGMIAGIALAEKNSKTKIFSILSDGELQEGSSWEAIMLIPSLKLKNVVIIIDNNNLQSLEKTSDTHPNLYPIEEKFRNFGWNCSVCNGHNSFQIYNKIKKKDPNKPFALIAKTIKGYPISFMKYVPMWHYKSPTPDEYKMALRELQL
jgi:transketolase